MFLLWKLISQLWMCACPSVCLILILQDTRIDIRAGWCCSNTLNVYSGGTPYDLGRNNGYPDGGYSNFPQYLEATSEMVLRLGSGRFHANHIQLPFTIFSYHRRSIA
jgi:hypothetical protein